MHENMKNIFLKDNSFLLWRFVPTEESDNYWKKYRALHPELKNEIEEAIRIMDNLKVDEYVPSDKELDILYSKIVLNARRRKLFINIYKYSVAACLLACILSSIIYFNYPSPSVSTVDSIAKKDSIYEDIQLFIGKEKSIALVDKAHIQYDKKGNLKVKRGNDVTEDLNVEKNQMNTLMVPMGKRSSLVLEDGTKIWVNSGSTVEFPTVFNKDIRKLNVSGEIYIEVAHDKKWPFIVQTSAFDVKVLGTRFNIMSYPNDSSKSVVLVEGCVEINREDRQKVCLKSGQMMELKQDVMQTSEVDIENYISWKDGVLHFKSEQLGKVLDRIARYYGIKIEYDKNTETKICSGELVLFDQIEDVFNAINDIYHIEYSKNDTGNIIEVCVKP